MRSSIIISSVLAAAGSVVAQNQTTGKLGDAAPIRNNPEGAVYKATLPNSSKNTVRGEITASSAPGGNGVVFQLTVSGLPEVGGPWAYHIHDQPVPTDGNCTGTLAHLDPYQRGQVIPCDAAAPQTCEVGDLAGKHGKINTTADSKTFTDYYAALVPGIGAFLGNRSIVIHYANSSRITCANFTAIATGSPNATSSPTSTGGSNYTATGSVPSSTPTGGSAPSGTQTPPAQQTTNAAMRTFVGSGAVLAAVAALML